MVTGLGSPCCTSNVFSVCPFHLSGGLTTVHDPSVGQESLPYDGHCTFEGAPGVKEGRSGLGMRLSLVPVRKSQEGEKRDLFRLEAVARRYLGGSGPSFA